MNRLLTVVVQEQQSRPPRIGVNLEWQFKPPGWDLRKVVHYGNKKRRRFYVAHLSQTAWQDFLANYTDAERPTAILQWAERMLALKGM